MRSTSSRPRRRQVSFSPGARAVADQLVGYGRQLEAERAAQEGAAFSGRPDVDAWLEHDPNAFLLGVLFTQGIPAERAWAGPWELRNRLGHLDLERLANTDVGQVEEALSRPPALHRFRRTLPRYIVGTARVVVDEFGGDASTIWADGPTAGQLADRLSALPGIGPKKAAMTVEILIRRFGVQVREHHGARLPRDVHVRRVMLRTGLVQEDDAASLQTAAAWASPTRPSLIDLPLWTVGRKWCRPRAARCDECLLAGTCPRLIGRHVEGVGVRRLRSASETRSSPGAGTMAD